MAMKLATYIGPLKHLVGEAALIVYRGDVVRAQFNNRHLRKSNEEWPQVWVDEPHIYHGGWWEDSEDPPFDALGFGWHDFPKDHWKEYDEQQKEK